MDYIKQIKKVQCINKNHKNYIQKRFDNLIKPVGSLAKLEDITCSYIAMRDAKDIDYSNKHLLLFLSEQEINEKYKENICDKNVFLPELVSGTSHIHKLAEFFTVSVNTVSLTDKFGILANIENRLEMNDELFAKAFALGEKAAENAIRSGADALAVASFSPGSYIANLAVLSAVMRKSDFIEPDKRSFVENIIKGETSDDLFVLMRKYGGYELPALLGAITFAAASGVMVFLDGLASLIAAYAAIKENDDICDYLVAVSTTNEDGQNILLTESKLSTMLDLKMNFPSGEASVFGFSLLEAGIKALLEMESFGDVHFPLGDIN